MPEKFLGKMCTIMETKSYPSVEEDAKENEWCFEEDEEEAEAHWFDKIQWSTIIIPILGQIERRYRFRRTEGVQ